MPERGRSPRAIPGFALAIALWAVVAAQPARGAVASTTWRLDVAPTTIAAADPTTIDVTFSNRGGPTGDDDLGCVRIAIPATFTVVPPLTTVSPPGTSWHASGTSVVSIHPSSGGDRLDALDQTSSVTASITVLAVVPGTFTWTATAYESQDCTKPFPEQIKTTVTVNLLPTAKPAPTPTPRPTPSPTPNPTPTVTPTAKPVPTPNPSPTPNATSAPGRTPVPGDEATPAPAVSPSPIVVGASADPFATPTPRLSPADGGPPTGAAGSARPTPSPASDLQQPSTGSGVGGGLLMAGFDDATGGRGSSGGGTPAISLGSGFTSPFGQGFAWAVPGLVLSVPGLLIVLAVIAVQAIGAGAWLPIVRRRIGSFGVWSRSKR